MKYIILCADDYGLNAGISQGIIDLLRRQRLSAVSCMSTGPSWSQYSLLLKPFENQVDLGLHFNLTEGRPVSPLYREKHGERFSSLGKLITRAYLGLLNEAAIEEELELQLKNFVDAMGFLPNFIDGHQHIQQLPIVREALLKVYNNRLAVTKPYLRSAYHIGRIPGLSANLKKKIIFYCGAAGFERLLVQADIPHNLAFSGIYNFSPSTNYAQLFPQFLSGLDSKGLIMCHPGIASAQDSDPIAAVRQLEYDYFASDQFPQDCLSQQVSIGRFA